MRKWDLGKNSTILKWLEITEVQASCMSWFIPPVASIIWPADFSNSRNFSRFVFNNDMTVSLQSSAAICNAKIVYYPSVAHLAFLFEQKESRAFLWSLLGSVMTMASYSTYVKEKYNRILDTQTCVVASKYTILFSFNGPSNTQPALDTTFSMLQETWAKRAQYMCGLNIWH